MDVNTASDKINETIKITTDIDRFDKLKKIKLFEAAKNEIDHSKGTLSKELRFMVGHMEKAYKDSLRESNNLKDEIMNLNKLNKELNEKNS